MKPSPQVRRAEVAIEHFESAGREVVGVAIMKDGFKLEFATRDEQPPTPDLVNMSGK